MEGKLGEDRFIFNHTLLEKKSQKVEKTNKKKIIIICQF